MTNLSYRICSPIIHKSLRRIMITQSHTLKLPIGIEIMIIIEVQQSFLRFLRRSNSVLLCKELLLPKQIPLHNRMS